VDADARPIGEARPIVVGHHEDFTPAWSPNGEWIAYHSHRSTDPVPFYASDANADDIYIRRADATTDQEIRLTDFGWEVGVADWSPDGSQLVFDSWERGGVPGVSRPWIATIDTATGQPVDITRLPLPPQMNGTLFLAWSPLGNEIAAIERVATGSFRQALWVIGTDGADAEKLLEFDASTYGGLDWTPDGANIVYSALAGDRMQLFALPRGGGDPHQLTDDDVGLIHPQVSPDGRWIAASRLDWSKELRRLPVR
jgi:Tol biopolymer transport system component